MTSDVTKTVIWIQQFLERKIFSVQNTEHPLKLKVRNVPCLCNACILDNGNPCIKSNYTDPWKEVDLVPVKGQTKRKYMKCKMPTPCGTTAPKSSVNEKCMEEEEAEHYSYDEDIPNISINKSMECEDDVVHLTCNDLIKEKFTAAPKRNIMIDLTEPADSTPITIGHVEDDDIIISTVDNVNSTELRGQYAHVVAVQDEVEIIPDGIYWESLLARLENCESNAEMDQVAAELYKDLRPLCARKKK